jgi:transglutaminase-like putative cysteine protease
MSGIRYTITHVTRYVYTEPVSLCHNVARLTPRWCAQQSLESSTLVISPPPAIRSEHLDYFQNPTTNFTIQDPHRELKLTATHTITVHNDERPLGPDCWLSVRDRLLSERLGDWLSANEYRQESPSIPLSDDYAAYAKESFFAGRPICDAVRDLTRRIHKDFAYDPQATTVTTTVPEVFKQRRGVCQDFAHFQIACLRSLGLAARYMSGYLSTTPPPGKPRIVGADASHAWISVFCGSNGWVQYDPTNADLPSDRYIVLAWGRDYSDVCPVKGVILGGGQHRVDVSVDAATTETR